MKGEITMDKEKGVEEKRLKNVLIKALHLGLLIGCIIFVIITAFAPSGPWTPFGLLADYVAMWPCAFLVTFPGWAKRKDEKDEQV